MVYKKISLEDIGEGKGIRTYMREEPLRELALSISEVGVLQPIIVVKEGDKYKVIIGHRRIKAAKKAGLTEIPAIVLEGQNLQESLLELAENLQREELHPFDEARAIIAIREETGLSDAAIAMKLGKSRTYVVKMASLRKLFPYLEKYPQLYTLPKRILIHLAGARPEDVEGRIKEILSGWRKKTGKQIYKFGNIDLKIHGGIKDYEESALQGLIKQLKELFGDAELEVVVKPKKKKSS